ncbi:hypothetical protein [Streptomyces sp. NBC_00878]|uniref:hypothetical protein n=1 Tax=Streptomyces sp. NBC_00878 TaxID=2975854 RepID=UPI00224D8835|nr:hypothetical protein [Streptomyces sp. NBC_00878]MCX4905939.1 hypothetical protein [Streptomyces sp. NBC_00878]
MADEQYRWLDRDTAERLLRGEPLEAVDADNREQADRLTEALDALAALTALTAESTPADAELPGEAAALAAFRTARTGEDGERASLGQRTRTRSASAASAAASRAASDAGLIHLGRPAAYRRVASRWGRPMRYGLAAALAAGMIGGVTVAATSGALSFDAEEPEPVTSSTVAVTPDRPLVSPVPRGKSGASPDDPRPEGSPDGPAGKGSAPPGEPNGGADPGAQPGNGDDPSEVQPGQGWRWLVSACRDYRDGKKLDSGRRNGLEDAANGAEQLKNYCKGVLKNWGDSDSGDTRRGYESDPNKDTSGQGGPGWNSDDNDGKPNNDAQGGDGKAGDGDSDDAKGGDGSHIGLGVSTPVQVRIQSSGPARVQASDPARVRTLTQTPTKTPTQTSSKASSKASAQASAQASAKAPTQTAKAPTRTSHQASTRTQAKASAPGAGAAPQRLRMSASPA